MVFDLVKYGIPNYFRRLLGIVTRVSTLVFLETNRFLVPNRARFCFFSNIYIYTIALSIYIYNPRAPGVGCRALHFNYAVHGLGLRPKLGLWTGRQYDFRALF